MLREKGREGKRIVGKIKEKGEGKEGEGKKGKGRVVSVRLGKKRK